MTSPHLSTSRPHPRAPLPTGIQARAFIADGHLKQPSIIPRQAALRGEGFEDGAEFAHIGRIFARPPMADSFAAHVHQRRHLRVGNGQNLGHDKFDRGHCGFYVRSNLTLSSDKLRLGVQDTGGDGPHTRRMDEFLRHSGALGEAAFGQNPAESLGGRLHRIRKLKKISQQQVAEFLDVARETITRWEHNVNEPNQANIKKLATLYATPAVYLQYGGSGGPKTVSVLGHVGAGANVFPFSDGPFEQIEAPFGSPDDLAALIVRGDSMMPELSDGDFVLYRTAQQNPDDLIGRRCILRLEDGAVLVKRLRRGKDFGCYDLDSTNAATIENQRLQWVAKVEAVKYR